VLARRFSTERNTHTETSRGRKMEEKTRHSKDTNKDTNTKEGSRELANDETQTTTTTIH
jgi:hypothetical protein